MKSPRSGGGTTAGSLPCATLGGKGRLHDVWELYSAEAAFRKGFAKQPFPIVNEREAAFTRRHTSPARFRAISRDSAFSYQQKLE